MSNPALSRNPAFNGQGYATFNNSPQAPQYGQPGGYPQAGQPGPSYSTGSAEQLEQMYGGRSAGPMDTGRMTYDDVIMKTGISFAVLLAAAAVSWFLANPLLMIVGLVVGLVLGLVNSFKKNPSPALILAYAGFEGLFLGGISLVFEAKFPGIVIQAVLATLCVFAVALFAFKSGKIRVTPKLQKMFMIAMGGYLVFCLVNMGSMMFFGNETLRSGALGFVIGLFAVGLAAFSLVMDFDMIEKGVKGGAPEKFAWYGAFALMVTLIWLYIEMLRLIAILRGD